jgi:predicted Rossmann fold nucleotide-binding protein DprA/Smf involved in DNA uptake
MFRRWPRQERYQQLLARGFQLSQAVEQWQSRAIWVAGHTDDHYPRRFLEQMKDHAPAIVYGCGDAELLNTGGLAVVGSRDVDPELVEFTENVGRLAALAKRTLISGGARGIDQASMRGAAESNGAVVGVLADSLERAAVNSGNRELLFDSKLTLITVFDPSAGFNVGHAMQRNRLIYALSDAALVVNSDHGKGWDVGRSD